MSIKATTAPLAPVRRPLAPATRLWIGLAVCVLACVAFMSINVVGPPEFILAFRGRKVLAMVLVGWATGVATVAFQTVTNNRLLTPSILGLDALYAFIQTMLVFLLGVSFVGTIGPYAMFTISLTLMLASAMALTGLLFGRKGRSVYLVVLAGLVLGSILRSLSSLISRVLDPVSYLVLQGNLFASFNAVNPELIGVGAIVVAAASWWLWRQRHTLDVLTLGRESAISLGVDYQRTVRAVLLVSTLLVCVSTALVGPSRSSVSSSRRSPIRSRATADTPTHSHGGAARRRGHRRRPGDPGTGLRARHRAVRHHRVHRRHRLHLARHQKGVTLMIEIKEVTKRYGRTVVVDDVTVSLPTGGVTAIVGANGAGKSTLLSMIARLLGADNGQITVGGLDIEKADSRELARRLAILRQSNDLNSRLTVQDLVAFGRYPHSGGRLTTKDREAIDQAIGWMNLEDLRDRFLDEMSGGQRQRAFVAMVLAQDTEYVLLDEPLNNLDVAHAHAMLQTLRRAADELHKTVVIVVHDINYASCWADQIVAMKHGRIRAIGSPREIVVPETLRDVFDLEIEVAEFRGRRIAHFYLPVPMCGHCNRSTTDGCCLDGSPHVQGPYR
ncbi:iron chelate uptake ABC transporter family permease subunit [Tessaracoccus sp. HDW20]|uniref:iron chelate uptake ABC transporter family permease subunit n=1 Tax=Tessaracoccus coleopterorum TaxID=2714950 RepID=UPI0018D3B8B7|nr:iron chelate uptake ABC transporter family permease subunit [Tessaracoccus coleopterorum]NHB85495.1 iron chelate uptake ABC transporter family permease subunit [Tessaracoccus coleopterorum]